MEQSKKAIAAYNNFILDELKNQGIKCMLSGGQLTYYMMHGKINYIKDIDLFFTSKEEWDKADAYFRIIKNCKVQWESNNAKKFIYKGVTIDLIKIFFDNPENLFKAFDFTINKFAIFNNDFFYAKYAFRDLVTRELIIENLSNPITTLKRIEKYTNNGFRISSEEKSKVMEAAKLMAEKEGKSIEELLGTCDNYEFSVSQPENVFPLDHNLIKSKDIMDELFQLMKEETKTNREYIANKLLEFFKGIKEKFPKKPQILPLDQIDLTSLISNCQKHLDSIYSDDYDEDNDYNHYIYSEAMKALFGKDIFDIINKKS